MTASALLLLSLVARAQEPAPPVDPVPAAEPPLPAEPAPPAPPPELTSALSALQASNARALLDAADRLLSTDTAEADRRSAASALAQSGDPAALDLLEAAVDARSPVIQRAALAAFATIPGPEALRVTLGALRNPAYVEEVRLAAVTAIGQIGTPEGGEALWTASSDPALPDELRRAAREELERAYPALLAERGRPADVGSTLGVLVGSAGNGLAGAVMLSAVGTWGQNEGAAVIGGIGGGIIGVGTGALYGATQRSTLGQGLAYTSGASWGFVGSLYASNALMGPRTGRIDYTWYEDTLAEQEATRRWRNGAAGARLAGTLGGAAAGYVWMRQDPDPADPLEVDLAGYLGLQMGLGVADLANGRRTGCDYLWDELGYSYADVQCDTFIRSVKARSWAGLGGMAAGLGTGALVSGGWSPDAGQLGFGAVSALELGWVGLWLPEALGTGEPDGNFRLGFHGGGALGLAAAHLLEPSPGRAALAGWGGVLGNALGAGLPMLAGSDDDQVNAAVMIPMGLGGVTAGTLLAPSLEMHGGDLAMLGVGVPLAAAQGAAMSAVLVDRDAIDETRAAGLSLSFPALVGVGLTGLTVPAEPKTEDMLFLGSAAAWGVWYGLLTPVALELEGDEADLILSSMLVGDAFLLFGGLALPEATLNLNPRRTVIPQLAGVSGATLGALALALSSPDGAAVARGAVVGSTVGLVGGGLVVGLMPERGPRASLGPRLPSVDLPGTWGVLVAPGAMEDGSPGVVATVSAVGW